MRVHVASDHAGFRLKAALVEKLRAAGHDVVDHGTDSPDTSVDYPDFGAAAARAVAADADAKGVLVCGSGLGIAMAAGKVPGVRAARVTEPLSAELSRRHNDANVLTLGERLTGPDMAWACVEAFLAAPFEGGRHGRRVEKIAALEGR